MAVTPTVRAATKNGFTWNSGASALEISLTPSTDGRVWVIQFLVGATVSAASVNGSGATIIANNTDPNGITMVAYQADVSSGSAVTFAVTCSTQPVYPAILVYSTGTDVELDDSAYSAASSGVSEAVALAASDDGAALAMAYYGAGTGQVPTWTGITSLGALDLSGNSVAVGSQSSLTDDASYDVGATFTGSNTVVGLTALTLVEAAAAQEITGAAFANEQTFGAGVLSSGAANITGAAVPSATTFGAGTISAGSVAITGAHFTNAQSFGEGTVSVLYHVALEAQECAHGTAMTSVDFSTSLGAGPYSLADEYDALIDGLTLNSSTGVLSGTPTDRRGRGPHEIRVQDAVGNTAGMRMWSVPDINPANYATAYDGTVINTEQTISGGTGDLLLANLEINDRLNIHSWTGGIITIYNPTVDTEAADNDGIRLSTSGDAENVTIYGGTFNTGLNGIITAEDTGVTHPGLRILNTRMIATGLSEGPTNKHGIYNQAPDALIEGNSFGPDTDYPSATGMHWGSGISTRSGSVVRGNRIRECKNDGIGYFADHPGAGTSLLIEQNDIDDINLSDTGRNAINLIALNAGASPPAVAANLIDDATIRNNLLGEGNAVQVASDYATEGVPVTQSNNVEYLAGVITGAAFTNTQTFGSGALSAGAVTITGDALASTTSFGAGAVTAGPVTIAGEGFANGQTFGEGTVTPGAVAITGSALSSETTFGAGAMYVGPVTIAGAAFENVQSFGAGVIEAGTANIEGAGFTNAQTFGSGEIAAGAVEITGSAFTNAQAFGAGALTVGPVNITGAAFENVSTFGAGVVSTDSGAIIGAAFVNESQFHSGTVSAGPVTITGAAIESTTTFGAGTVSAGQRVITGAGFTNPNTFGLGMVATGSVAITGAGFVNETVFGGGLFTAGHVGIVGSAFTNVSTFGAGTFTLGGPRIIGAAFENVSTFGAGHITVGAVTITGQAWANQNTFGAGVFAVFGGSAPIGERIHRVEGPGRVHHALERPRVYRTGTTRNRI